METMFIIHRPGMVPQVGYPTGDTAASLREWQASNPDAAIYVIEAADVPPPGTAAVQTASEYLAMDDVMNDVTPNVI
jgi:hypothetical protein